MFDSFVHTVGLGRDYRVGGHTLHALRDVAIDIATGEFVVITGPSGSGKSTFLNLLGCLDRPTSGGYWFEGRDVSKLDVDALAEIRNRKIGFVFQNFNLMARSNVIENVELPLLYAAVSKADRRRRTAAVLATVGLEDCQDHWPTQLSGGQQQRVAVARALVNDPALILADEPTGSLDSRSGLEILALLQELNRAGITVVLVSHDLTVARHAKRMVAFHDGRMIDDQPVPAPLDAARELAELPVGEAAGASVTDVDSAP